MRLRFWRSEQLDEALDPEVLSVFAASAKPPTVDAAIMARGRTRVIGQLRAAPAVGGGVQRRLAYGFAGGGGIWGSIAGVAAAHKAATVVGVGVLLVTGAAAEVTGIGPAVRDAVNPMSATSAPPANPTAEATLGALATSEAQSDAEQDGAGASDGEGAVVSDGSDDTPGNLVAQLRADGSFTLRGVLVTAESDLIEVQTSLDDVPLEFALGDATVRLPRANNPGGQSDNEAPQTLEDFEGHLLLITGQCETTEGQLTEDCDLATITVLGNAGQNAPPDGVGPLDNPGRGSGNGPREDPGPPDGAGRAEDNSPPAAGNQPPGTGRPDDPGKPENVPANGVPVPADGD